MSRPPQAPSDQLRVPPEQLRVVVLERLDDHAAHWDRLVEGSPLPSPFLRSWWLDHAASGTPAIVCCFDGGHLVGGAAFELHRLGRGRAGLEVVHCLGQGPLAPDHLDVVAAADRAVEVTRTVLAWLHRPGSRVVDLDGLAAGGHLGRALARDTITTTAAPFASLSAGLDDYLAERPGRVRSTLKRTGKRLDRDGVTHRRAAPEAFDAALDRLAALHDGRWADESDFLTGWDQLSRAVRAGAALGDVALHELVTSDGDVVASELDLTVGRRTAFYQAGRRTDREWRGSGSVLRWRILGSVVPEGISEYDLLRGDEPYKAEWSTGRRELLRCRFGVGAPARAVLGAHRARVSLSALVQRLDRRDELSDPGPSTPDRTAPPEPPG